LTGDRQFLFPRSNFENSYEYNKIYYTVSNAAVSTGSSSSYLNNQRLRYIFQPHMHNATTVYSTPLKDEIMKADIKDNAGSNLLYRGDDTYKEWRLRGNSSGGPPVWRAPMQYGYFLWGYKQAASNCSQTDTESFENDSGSFYSSDMKNRIRRFTASRSSTFGVSSGTTHHWWDDNNAAHLCTSSSCSHSRGITVKYAGSSTTTVYLVEVTFDFNNSYYYQGFIIDPYENAPGTDLWLSHIFCYNRSKLSTSSSSLNRLEISYTGSNGSGYVRFYGDGNLYLQVIPNPSRVVIPKTDGTGDTKTISPGSSLAPLTIDPATHQYEDQGDGTYRITLSLTNVQLSNPQMVDALPVCEYTKLRNPVMGRGFDWSQSNSSRIRFGQDGSYSTADASDLFHFTSNYENAFSDLSYSTTLGCWTLPYNRIIAVIPQLYHGDITLVAEDPGTTPPLEVYLYGKGMDAREYNYYSSGLVRSFASIDRHNSADKHFIRLDNKTSGVSAKLMWASATYPINTVLYLGMNGAGGHFYRWQSDGSGNLTTLDATAACRNVTRSACEKLKSDWGENIRIYVIKYRRQPNCYQSPLWRSYSTILTLDYSYLDDCASGVIAPYLWDVSTEADLKSALSAIAADIKSFGGYAPVRGIR
jgi:hypothetical protein